MARTANDVLRFVLELCAATAGRIVVECVFFGSAAIALAASGGVLPAAALASMAAVNTMLMYAWRLDQRARAGAAGTSDRRGGRRRP